MLQGATTMYFEQRDKIGYDEVGRSNQNVRKNLVKCYGAALRDGSGFEDVERKVDQCIATFMNDRKIFWEEFIKKLESEV